MFSRLAVFAQYLLPKLTITVIAGKFAGSQSGRLTTLVIRWFVGHYGVNMQEAEHSDIVHYTSFNAFFTRPLKAGARPLAQADYICPVDGAISQFGNITHDQIFQAKGHQYSTTTLLAGNQGLARHFENGSFATLYLSPKDYHRLHMPCDGKLVSMSYVPGSLFSVNPATAQGVPGLFARNERVVCEFTAQDGSPFVLVLVGATIVGSMATVWHGVVNPPRRASVNTWNYAGQEILLRKGEEMGRFLLGSTVVMLFPNKKLQFNPYWAPQRNIRLGEMMAGRANDD